MNAVHCPICKRFLGTIAPDGTFDTLCPPCGRRTKVLTGRVNWVQMSPTRKHSKEAGKTVPHTSYELRLKDAGGKTHAPTIETRGESNPLHLTKGDNVSIMWIDDKPFSVRNETTAHFIKVAEAPWSKKQTWIYGSIAVGCSVGFAIGAAGAPFPLVIILVGAIVFLGYRMGVRTAEKDKRTYRLLIARQEMLLQIYELNGKKAHVEEEMRRTAETAKKLFSLRTKIEALGDDMYKNRCSVVERALRQIGEMRESQLRLIAEYEKAISMLEIECEINDAAHSIDAIGEDFSTQMATIKAVEEAVTALRCQVEANDEVMGLRR